MAVEVIKNYPLDKLVPTENNPRTIKKDDFERLKKSLATFGEMLDVREIVVDENDRILGGHQRVKALLANKEKTATIKRISGWSEEQKREFIIRDNIQNGEWDMDMLANEWDDLPLDEWGIELPTMPEINEEDDAESEPKIDASEVMIASATLFGKSSDIVLAEEIRGNDAEIILQKIEKNGSEVVMSKIMEAINAL